MQHRFLSFCDGQLIRVLCLAWLLKIDVRWAVGTIQDLQNYQNHLKSCWKLGGIPIASVLVTCLQTMNDALGILPMNLQSLQS